MTDTWYYDREGHSVGPVSREQLITELLRSPYWQQEYVWKPGYSDWVEAGSVNELSSELAQSELEHHVQYESSRPRPASGLAAVLVYAGLAILGVVSAITYYWWF
jgi:GYF domain 2